MKTFYTLLLAFGLCLTSHAQSNIVSLESFLNTQTQSSQILSDVLDEGNILYYDDSVLYSDTYKIVDFKSLNQFYQFNNFSQISTAVVIAINIDDEAHVLQKDLSQLSSLQYIILYGRSNHSDVIMNDIKQNIISSNQLIFLNNRIILK